MTFTVQIVEEPTRRPWLLLVKDGPGPSRIVQSFETRKEALAVARRLERRAASVRPVNR